MNDEEKLKEVVDILHELGYPKEECRCLAYMLVYKEGTRIDIQVKFPDSFQGGLALYLNKYFKMGVLSKKKIAEKIKGRPKIVYSVFPNSNNLLSVIQNETHGKITALKQNILLLGEMV